MRKAKKEELVIVRFDKKTKQELKAFSKEIGMTMSAVIYAQVRMILRDGKIFYSAERRQNAFLRSNPVDKTRAY